MKVSVTMLLRHEGGLGLGEAKRLTDAIVDDKTVTIEIENNEEAEDFVKKSE